MKSKEWIERQDDSVKRCLEVAASPQGTFYLIETTFDTFPRFVVGNWHEESDYVQYLLKCFREESARDFWQRLTGQVVPQVEKAGR